MNNLEHKTRFFFCIFQKNLTHDGVFIVNTGYRDPIKTGTVEYWNGHNRLDNWLDNPGGSLSSCNKINGTDGTQFPPFRPKEEELYIFSADICRYFLHSFILLAIQRTL